MALRLKYKAGMVYGVPGGSCSRLADISDRCQNRIFRPHDLNKYPSNGKPRKTAPATMDGNLSRTTHLAAGEKPAARLVVAQETLENPIYARTIFCTSELPSMFTANRARFIFALCGFLCLAGAVTARSVQIAPRTATKKGAYSPDTSEEGACSNCHKEEVDGYARSKMSISMRLPGQEPQGIVQVPGSTIRMESDSTGAWQILESHGQTSRFRVAYVIGSGAHADGYIVSLDNHLFQSPVSYYRYRAAYGLAPGYEDRPDPNFSRPVEPRCLFCHAGEFRAIPGTQNEYAPVPFSHLSIDCSRCHGPIDAHLKHPSRSNIVNPARLPPAARDSICEQCHLSGAARVLNPGKKFTDFVPGQPLEETFSIYHFAVPEGDEPPFEVISHSEELALSKCKRASGDRLWCGTCHNPHHEPADPVSYYRAKCLSCHAGTQFPSDHPSMTSNCIGCHMPTKQTTNGGHTVFTDHYIQRRAGDRPIAEPTDIVPWRDPPHGLAKRNFGIASIDAGMEQRSSALIVSGYRTLTEVKQQFPRDSEMYNTMGSALLIGRQYGEAAQAFELAVRFDPNSSPKKQVSVRPTQGSASANLRNCTLSGHSNSTR